MTDPQENRNIGSKCVLLIKRVLQLFFLFSMFSAVS